MRLLPSLRRSATACLAVALIAGCSKSDSGTTAPPAVDHMMFLTPPSQTHSGQPIYPSVQVALVDASGAPVTTATGTVTIALAAPVPAGGALTGTLTVQAVAGVATFVGLQVGPVATGYSLEATSAGLTTITSSNFDVFAPMPPAASSIIAGEKWTCAMTASGPYCWGHNGGGELGINADSLRKTPAAVLAPAGGFSQMVAGSSETCGLGAGGAAWCWGHNYAGGVGDGTIIDRYVPTAVSGGHVFTAITDGDDAGCGLTASGGLYCWGYNARGQLGNGTTTSASVPDSVLGGPYAFASAGASYACALTAAGAAYCWGMNFSGNLGDGTFTDRSTPVAVLGGLVFTSFDTGGGQTCGLIASGAAYCWGDNSYGQVGDSTNFQRSTPVAVVGGFVYSAISAGGEFTCGIQRGTGQAYCWGHNDVGELGNATTTDSNYPTPVSGGHSFSQISVGFDHACALESGTAAIYCWGYNNEGQVGNGTLIDSHVPVLVVP